MTTHITKTPLEAKVREYFSAHGITPKEHVGFEVAPHVPMSLRAWICEISFDAVRYRRSILSPQGANTLKKDIEFYHENGAYIEHLEIISDGKELSISTFPVTNEYQIITTIGKKSVPHVTTSIDEVIQLLPEPRKIVA